MIQIQMEIHKGEVFTRTKRRSTTVCQEDNQIDGCNQRDLNVVECDWRRETRWSGNTQRTLSGQVRCKETILSYLILNTGLKSQAKASEKLNESYLYGWRYLGEFTDAVVLSSFPLKIKHSLPLSSIMTVVRTLGFRGRLGQKKSLRTTKQQKHQTWTPQHDPGNQSAIVMSGANKQPWYTTSSNSRNCKFLQEVFCCWRIKAYAPLKTASSVVQSFKVVVFVLMFFWRVCSINIFVPPPSLPPFALQRGAKHSSLF